MRTIAVCAVLLTIGVLIFSAADVGGDPAPLVLTARIVRGAVEDLPSLEQGVFKILDEKELAELRQVYDAVPGGESVVRVTAGPPGGSEHEFSLTELVRISYTADYEAASDTGGEPRAIRRTINEGTILDVGATTAPNGATVTLNLRLTRAALTRPIPTFATNMSGPTLTIELPELTVRRTKESITLAANRWAAYRAARDTLILLGAEAAPAGGGQSDLPPDLRPR